MSEALNTHNYDGKWEENLNAANKKYEQFINKYHIDENIAAEACDIISLSGEGGGVKSQAMVWRTNILANDAVDPANKISPKELLQKIEKCIQAKIKIENEFGASTKNICELYSLPIPSTINDIHLANLSIINSYVEQLADVSNGSCIQGQTTRLFQIFSALI